ncbi:MAG: DUF2163 domain-containing protein [Pseudomonadota bacterium]
MQTIPNDLATHLAQEVTTLATCWSITRKDGVSYYFTEHDRDVVVEGQVYAAASGMSPSAVTSQSGLAVDNLEFAGMLSAEVILESDILSGRYDHAELSIFMVNYADPAMGKLHLKTGWLGEVTLQGGQFVAEMRGLSSRLQQTIGEVYTSTCRARLGDARCTVELAGYTVSGTVTAVEAAHAFSDSSKTQPNGYFSYGVVTFTSGANAGLSMEVREFSSSRFGLFLPMAYAIEVGDTFTAIAGCDKVFDTCIGRFGNAVNFRGEPHVPGTDKMLETTATRSG